MAEMLEIFSRLKSNLKGEAEVGFKLEILFF